jgi:hypothetical protein
VIFPAFLDIFDERLLKSSVCSRSYTVSIVTLSPGSDHVDVKVFKAIRVGEK